MCSRGAGLGSDGGFLSLASHHHKLEGRGPASREEDGGVVWTENVFSGESHEMKDDGCRGSSL